jgi:hypothetical protein
MTDHEQPSIPGFCRDPKPATRFVADEPDEEGRAELPDQVAAVAMYHVGLPDALAVPRRPVGRRAWNAAPERHTHHDAGREPDRFPAPDWLACSAE